MVQIDDLKAELEREEDKMTEVATSQKLGVGTKVVLTGIVLGSVAAGIYFALSLAQ